VKLAQERSEAEILKNQWGSHKTLNMALGFERGNEPKARMEKRKLLMSSSAKDFVMDLTDCVTDLYSALGLARYYVTNLTDLKAVARDE